MSRSLPWLALAVALGTAGLLFGPVWADSGTFAVWALGLPVLLCVAPIVTASSRYSVVITYVVAAVLLGWSLLLGLGIGLFLLPTALVEFAAAGTRSRQTTLRT
jgi:hypothetical protein